MVGLVGDLGAGKTTFVQGLAQGLGVPASARVRSPTFTVVNTYAGGRVLLHHLDFYRLDDVDSLYALGYEDYLDGRAACVIEWLDHLPEAAPADYLRVELSGGEAPGEEHHRTLVLTANGPRSRVLLAGLTRRRRHPAAP